MEGFDRLYELHRVLAGRRGPISTRDLLQRLECSRPTLQRTIQHLRDAYDAPILNAPGAGYFYDRSAKPFELPGLWFSAAELHALLTMQELLDGVQPTILKSYLEPFLGRIRALLHRAAPGHAHFPSKKIRILPAHNRKMHDAWFQTLANALVEERRVNLRYRSRSRNVVSERDISPQRLVYYRDNWYLDGWCHKTNGIRTFALDRVEQAIKLENRVNVVADPLLDAHLASSYGIFAGEARHVARLRFTPERARWVADESWHPQQSGQFTTDGFYELQVPYSEPNELVGEILRHGVHVEVLGPSELRERVRGELTAARRLYE